MKVQTYRPRIQNGHIAKRRGRAVAPKVKVSDRSSPSRRSSSPRRRGSKDRQRGSNILWILMFIGAFVAAGFIFALRSQINVHQLGQAEAQLKAELDEMANRQRYEVLEQQRALSPRESDRAAKQAGLIQPRLNQPNLKLTHAPIPRSEPDQVSKGKKESNIQRPSSRTAQRR